jgi:threonylcarbamoyladenosine tRNA methylthiotransferase MtaB
MGRRYDTAGYASIVERARAAISGLAVHADVMAGFPTEDDDAHTRSLGFIRSIDPAGLHVFRYSERPGTAAVRMAGAVDDRTRKRRAADLLALAAEARTRFARRAIGGERSVLIEERLVDGRWTGRSEDYVEVAVGGDDDMAGAVVQVAIDTVDATASDRVVGRVIARRDLAA